jgi:hypothetical protein
LSSSKRMACFVRTRLGDVLAMTDNPKVLSMASAIGRIQYRLPLVMTEIEKIERAVRAALRLRGKQDQPDPPAQLVFGRNA